MRKKKKNNKVFTEADFKQVKLLQEAKVSATKAALFVGRSSGTTSRVYRSKTYQEYRDLVTNQNAKRTIVNQANIVQSSVPTVSSSLESRLASIEQKLDLVLRSV